MDERKYTKDQMMDFAQLVCDFKAAREAMGKPISSYIAATKVMAMIQENED